MPGVAAPKMSKSHKYCKVGQLWLTFMHTPGEDNERHALQRVWSRRVGFFHGHWEMLPMEEVFFHTSVLSTRNPRGMGSRSKPAFDICCAVAERTPSS